MAITLAYVRFVAQNKIIQDTLEFLTGNADLSALIVAQLVATR